MDYNTILLVAGLVIFLVGLLGVLVDREGRPSLLIKNIFMRGLLIAVGLGMGAYSIFSEVRREQQTNSEIQKKASPALAAYLADCALEVDRHETEYPEVPYKNSKFRTVLLQPGGTGDGQFVDMLLERFREQYDASQGLPTIAWPAGAGKSVLVKMVRVEACRRGLQGDVGMIVVARDARRDLQQAAQRSELAAFLTAMPTDFAGQQDDSRRFLLIDSIDELYYGAPETAQAVVRWAQTLAKDEKHPVSVYLFSRRYAIDKLNAIPDVKLLPIYQETRSDAEYFERAVYSILRRELARGGTISKKELEDEATRMSQKLDEFLGAPWTRFAVKRQLTYRDIEAIVEGGMPHSRDGKTLGDAYYAYAVDRLTRDFGDDVIGTEQFPRLLSCLADQARQNVLTEPAPRAGGRCEEPIKYVNSGREMELPAATILRDRAISVENVAGPIQDVIAAVALCQLEHDAPENTVQKLARSNDQGPAIALSAEHSLPTCTVRTHYQPQTLAAVTPSIQQRFGLTTAGAAFGTLQ